MISEKHVEFVEWSCAIIISCLPCLCTYRWFVDCSVGLTGIPLTKVKLVLCHAQLGELHIGFIQFWWNDVTDDAG